jgi:1,4-dihydroxy-2-naphthoate octaprenyltransferase
MKISIKITRAIIFLFALFVLALTFTLIENYPTFHSAYDYGYYTGVIFRHMLKILGSLALFILAFRLFKKNWSL